MANLVLYALPSFESTWKGTATEPGGLLTAIALLAGAVTLARVLFNFAKQGRAPPAAWGLPGIGDSYAFWCGPVTLMEKRFAQLGDIYSHELLGQKVTHIRNGATVNMLLANKDNVVKAYNPATFKLVLGPGSLSNMHGDEHASLRRLLSPAFSYKAIAGYVPRIVSIFEAAISEWVKLGTVHGNSEINSTTFKVGVEVIVGFDDSWLAQDRQQAIQDAWTDLLAALFSMPFSWLQFIPGTGLYNGLRARKYLLKATEEAVERVREQIDSGDVAQEGIAHALLTERDERGELLDKHIITDTCLGMLLAAHATTSNAIQVLLLKLKQNPCTLPKLREEQNQVIAQHGPEIREAAIKDMVYADACARETLRMHPIAYIVARETLRDLELDGYRVPKGSTLWLSLGEVTKYQDKRWVNHGLLPTTEFLPERWLEADGSTTGSWIPFGGGARYCMGKTLAMMEMKVLLAIMVRRCDWEVDVNERITTFPITSPENGLPMKIKAIV